MVGFYFVSPRHNHVIAECHIVLVIPFMTSNQLHRATAIVSRRFMGGPRLQTPSPLSLVTEWVIHILRVTDMRIGNFVVIRCIIQKNKMVVRFDNGLIHRIG
jgi:hypothetical protein